MLKTCYEWVVTYNDGQEFYLSEKQHDLLVKSQDQRFVSFREFTLNPAFVMNMYRRPAEELKKKYPCKNCYTTGYTNGSSGDICSKCEGTGVNLTL